MANDSLVFVRRSCYSTEDDSGLLQYVNKVKTKITTRILLSRIADSFFNISLNAFSMQYWITDPLQILK